MDQFRLKKINDIRVTPMNLPIPKKSNNELFETPYPCIFICAKRKSGKTFVINTIVHELVKNLQDDTDLDVYVFSSMVNRDPAMKNIVKYLQKKNNIKVKTFTEIIGVEVGKNKKEIPVNYVEEILKSYTNVEEEEEDQKKPSVKTKKEPIPIFIKMDIIEPKKEKPDSGLIQSRALALREESPRKKEVLFIFDDLGTQLDNRWVTQLCKTSRHIKATVILSSQAWSTDLARGCRQQLDYILLLGKHDIDKIEDIRHEGDISTDPKTFQELYRGATSIPYNFLYIDVKNDKYRLNFDTEIILPDKSSDDESADKLRIKKRPSREKKKRN